MSFGAGAHRFKGTLSGIGNMALVVRTVQVLAIPASRKGDSRPNPTLAGLGGKRGGVRSCAGCAAARAAGVVLLHVAAVAQLALLALGLAQGGVADEHAEARLEGGHGRLPVVRRDVVDGDAADGADADVGELGHAPVGAVAGAEVQHRRPVVGEVLGERAARAGRVGDQVVARRRVHARVERVAAHDLVHVRRRHRARVYQRVEALDDELRAAEPDHLLGGGCLREERDGQGFPIHFGTRVR